MADAIDMNLKFRRLAIFERVKDKLDASGQPVQEDAPFLELVEQWTEGRIELDEVLKGYRKPSIIVSQPAPDYSPLPEVKIKDDEADLLADLERVIEIVDLTEMRADS